MIDDDNPDPKLVFKWRLCEKTTVESPQNLGIEWSPKGDMLGLPGSKSLGILKVLDDDKFEQISIPEITHEKVIIL